MQTSEIHMCMHVYVSGVVEIKDLYVLWDGGGGQGAGGEK